MARNVGFYLVYLDAKRNAVHSGETAECNPQTYIEKEQLGINMDPKFEFDELVAANRILAHEQVVDAFGHVSLRHPDNPHRYVLSRSRAPELVEFDDLLEF